ncbi:MAG: 30S ribosomal protein S6 [Candidatus Azambacteria bacterium]|nr:30S ribosomal protein S6 [Candidatus Azambacteria bacterium]
MNEAENKKEYELAYLLTSEISEEKIDSEVSELKDLIAKNGGDIIQANLPEKRRLAYPVKKENFSYFGVVYFNASVENLDGIKKALLFYKKVLRYLLLNKETKLKPVSLLESQPEKIQSPTAQTFEQRLESLLNS